MAELSAEFVLASARWLPSVADGHPCGRMHGHTFTVGLVVQGPIQSDTGWVLDFADLHAAWAPIHEALDHRVLNEVPGLENPTSEHLALWIWRALEAPIQTLGAALAAVTVAETGGFRVTYRGG
jgi:6-pyruvoyltetrahydropterin/6-carboxytetrahydropterin synthase